MTLSKKGIIYITITLAIMVFIFIQSALTADISSRESSLIVDILAKYFKANPDLITTIVRKCAHFLEYLCLGASLFLTVREISGKPVLHRPGFSVLIPWIIGTLYAVTDEIHQHFVPGRSCEARDMLIDSCGILTGVIVVFLFIKKRLSKTG